MLLAEVGFLLQRFLQARRMLAEFPPKCNRLKKVGAILSQSTKERDFIASTGEIRMMAQVQNELGEKAVTALVSWEADEKGGQVHFEVGHQFLVPNSHPIFKNQKFARPSVVATKP